MRRIAAVFSSKRDRSDAASSSAASTTTEQTQAAAKSNAKRFFRSISRKSKPVDPVLNTINSGDFLPPSSSSSSSGAPTTPDDDRGSLLKVSTSKVWSPLPPIPVDSSLGSFHHFSTPHDRVLLSAGPRPTPSPSTFEDVSSEESSVAPDLSRPPERSVPQNPQAYLLSLTSSKLGPPYAPPPLLHVPGGPEFPRSCNARRSLPYAESLESTMHRSSLQRRLQRGDLSPTEARSIASFTGRRAAPKDRPSLFLDETAVRVGHIRPSSAGLRKWVERPCFEDRLCVLVAENLPSSGLNAYGEREPRWTRVEAATGCGVADLEYSLTLELLAGLYEDILPSEHSQERQGPAPDTSALVHLRLDTQLPLDLGPSLTLTQPTTTLSPSPPPGPTLQATMSTTSLTTAPSTVGLRPAPAITSTSSRSQSYKASPSPLRIEAASAPPPTPSTPTMPQSTAISPPLASPTNSQSPILSPQSPPSAAPPLKPALKQGVRFVEGEKEDRDEHVPLGYVMRIKQKREEKARFLQAERQRRQHEEARRKHEEEKRKWEEERAAWEKEKRAMEEDRKKRLYADEVAAARSRRESQRIGFGPVTGEGLATGQWDRGDRPRPARESSASYSRPVYDPAAHTMPRTASDSYLAMPQSHRGSTSGSGSGSPEDSRPNSIYGSGSGTGSRPSSMHSGVPTPASSQQDVRPRERHNSGSRHATSVASETGSSRRRSEVPVPPLPPMWNVGMHPNMSAPPVLMPGMGMPMAMPIGMPMAPMATMGMPMYGMPMDMPLLPPSPPFMHQYGRRSSSGHSSSRSRSPSHSGHNSPTLSKRDLPSNNSSERVNRTSRHGHEPPHGRGSSLPRSETGSSSHTHRPTHNRAGSGDSSRAHRPPVSGRSQTELAADRRSSRAGRQPAAPPSPPTASPRPKPTHSSSLPPNPPVAFSQARSSWALPQSGFENLSRPSGRRQTMIS